MIFVNYSGNPNDLEISEKVQKVCRDIIRELPAITTVYVLINEEYKQDSLKQVFAADGIQNKNIILLLFTGSSVWEFREIMAP